MSKPLVFISAGNFGKPASADRKIIRSQCMRGRNRNVIVYSATHAAHTPPHVVHHHDRELRKNSRRGPEKSTIGNKSLGAGAIGSMVPRAPPLDLSFGELAIEVDGHSRDLLYKYYHVAANLLYIGDVSVEFAQSRVLWYKWLFYDVAYLHATLFTASAIDDSILRSHLSKKTYLHLTMAIRLLNEQLSDSIAAISDSTVAIVVLLAAAAGIFGDITAARNHIAGLQQMVYLRGGLQSFSDNNKLHHNPRSIFPAILPAHNSLSTDVSFALTTGEKPRFLYDPISYNLGSSHVHHLSDGTIYEPSPPLSSMRNLEERRVARIFSDLQSFTSLMNATGRGTKRRIQKTEFQNVFFSIQYRLLQLQGTLQSVLGECLRLAMLAFMTTTFRVPGTRLQYPYLADRFCECCRAIETSASHPPDLMLWLLTIGAISVFGVNEPWLRARWQSDVPRLAWPNARRRLRDILWIDALHDEPGRCAFEAMSQFEEESCSERRDFGDSNVPAQLSV